MTVALPVSVPAGHCFVIQPTCFTYAQMEEANLAIALPVRQFHAFRRQTAPTHKVIGKIIQTHGRWVTLRLEQSTIRKLSYYKFLICPRKAMASLYWRTSLLLPSLTYPMVQTRQTQTRPSPMLMPCSAPW